MTTSRLAAVGIALALIAPLASTAGSRGGSHSHGGPIGITVKVSDAWLAPTEDGRDARMYMNVVTSENAKLVYAFTREAQKVELRETRLIDGELKDQHASWIQTWAEKTINFAPGSNYLLVTGIAQPLMKGSTLTLTMHFDGDNGQRQFLDVTAETRDQANAAVSQVGDK
jgi:periplasmic copper chaperone A